MNLPQEGSFTIIVKTDQSENEITGFDFDRNAFKLNIKKPAENNKANLEIIKFLKKQGLNVKIIKGLKNKVKLIKIIQ